MRRKTKKACLLLAMLCLLALPPSGAAMSSFEYWDQKCAEPQIRETVRCLIHRAQSLAITPPAGPEKIRQAIILYKKALAQDSWNVSAASGLASAYLRLKDYPSALKALNCTISRQPWFLEMRLFRCQLLEGMGLPLEKAKRCFADVANRYRENERFDADYVLAALLAESPEAAEAKREFHERAKPGTPEEYLWRNFIEDFDRDVYLKKSKLVEEGYRASSPNQEITPADCVGVVPDAARDAAASPSERAVAQRKEAEYHTKVRRQQAVSRAQFYLAQKDYGAALEIVEAEPASESAGDYLQLLGCLLREKTGHPSKEYQVCYRQYLAALEQGDFYTSTPNYVRVGILAYWPDKNLIREKVLANFMPGTQDQKNWDQYLDILRRQDVFEVMFKW